jgi:leucyl-tRNA synthetase
MTDDSRPRYDPATIEPKWQAHWDEHQTFRAERHPGRRKLYILDMFPYPSGSGLHVGHPEGYTATDIVSRYWRMRGVDVLHPMGWDAFGLPAEQHAIRTGTHPRATTVQNIATFRRQLKTLGFSYDWSREVDTTDPAYVRWTQWIFLKLFERGLAYQAEAPVNWCPGLGTVLANEEVIDGKSEVGGFPVERLPLRQWMLKITAYADRLDADLAGLDWPETKEKQHQWIGRSVGAEVAFATAGGEDITVFTTRVDTLAGATYVVLAPEHPLVDKLVAPGQAASVRAYVEVARNKSDRDRAEGKTKTGVALGATARNPINGDELPIWVADYVIGTYGTGAVMAVPAHDERDHEFARAHGLPIVQVIAPRTGEAVDVQAAAYLRDDDEAVTFRQRTDVPVPDGLPTRKARELVTAWLEARGKGRSRVTYRLRDWVFSRQRYWGEPIPVYFPVTVEGDPRAPGAKPTIHYERPIAVDERELPVRLPDLEDFKPGSDPAGALARVADWRFFQKDGQWYARETNTMPQWAGSCWYYLRYLDPKNDREAWSQKAYSDWMPVDLYIGGAEHGVLHLFYARFWHKVLYDAGLVRDPEPFLKLVHQGIILGEFEHLSFRDAGGQLVSAERARESATDGVWEDSVSGEALSVAKVSEEELEKKGEHFYLKAAPGVRVLSQAFKMAKSRGNVINPDDLVKSHGADSLRLYEMFMGPLEQVKPWQTSGIEGVRRFLDRVWNVATGPITTDPAAYDDATRRLVHKTVQKVTHDIEALRFNTAVSAMMILARHLGGLGAVPVDAARTLALILSPFAPHLGEELWQRLGGSTSAGPTEGRVRTQTPTSLAYVPWPEFDPALVKDDVVELGVQVNGKVRAAISVPADADEEAVKAAALAEEKVRAQVEGKTIKKVIYVKGRIVNFIVG